MPDSNNKPKQDKPECYGNPDESAHDLEYKGRDVRRNKLWEVYRCRRTGCYKEFLEIVPDED